MKTASASVLDLSSLPEQARREATDFYQFLKKKYRVQATGRVKKKEMAVQTLSDDSFVGIWKDRTDMKDSAGWVREQRESARSTRVPIVPL
jgi:hypothetical protein